jgi:exonuclease I
MSAIRSSVSVIDSPLTWKNTNHNRVIVVKLAARHALGISDARSKNKQSVDFTTTF